MEQTQSGKNEHKQKGGGRFEKLPRMVKGKKLGGNRKKEALGLKYLKWVSWGTLLGCAVVLCALGFAAGRLTAPKPEAAQPQSTELSAEVPENTQEGASQSVENQPAQAEAPATSEEQEQSEREVQPAEAAQNPVLPQYLLRRSGEQLVILQGETVLTAFSPDWTQVPKEEQSLLETGIPFETLSQIESYLEGYEG